MRVLNVIMTLDPLQGGSVERTVQMSKFLVKAGVECSLLTTDSNLPLNRLKELDGVDIIALPCINKRFYIPKFTYNKLTKIIEQCDIIHLMNHWIFLNAIVVFIARCLNKPYVLCPAGSLSIYGRSKILKKIYNVIVGKRIVRNASAYIAIAPNEMSHFQSHGIKKEKVVTIPNGINKNDFLESDILKFRNKYGLSNAPIILFLGRLNIIKGPDLLLNAFCNVQKKLNGYQLLFVGPDNGIKKDLSEIITRNGMDNKVHFIDYIEGQDKSHAYHVAKFVVIPSRQEAMSIVVLEAGISSTPVLLTDQCGFNEVVNIGGGKVVSASVEGLQEGMVEMVKEENELEIKGKKLKNFVSKYFLWECIVDQYIELYKEVLDTRKK